MQDTAYVSYSCIVSLNSAEDWSEASNAEFSPLKKVFDEVLIVSPDQNLKMRLPPNFKRITSQKNNRAHQYNLGAQEAKGDFLCFIPHGSNFDPESFAKIRLSLKPETLFYQEFKFIEAYPAHYKLNEWAINLRADLFKLPFSNQSYTLDKKTFFQIGAFSERVIHNEDAEFIKRWKHKGLLVKKSRGIIKNTPLRFKQNGWLKTTFKDLLWSLKYSLGKEPRELIPHVN